MNAEKIIDRMRKAFLSFAPILGLLLFCACRSADQRALERAEEGIEKYRKSDAEIIIRLSGEPVEGARVKVKLLRHAFLFGANIHQFGRFDTPDEELLYRERFARIFNYATLGLYWRSLEREQGEWDHERVGEILDWCENHEIELKGHSLIWIQGAGVPAWSRKMPGDRQRRDYVRRIVGEYRDRIRFWEVLNEPAHKEAIPFAPLHEVARKTAPGAVLILNDFAYYEDPDRMEDFFRRQDEYSHLYDAIGIQAHAPPKTWYRPGRWMDVLDRMARFRKPLHITEYFVPSDGSTVQGICGQRRWDEQAQAEAAEEFYKLCFGHPAVEAISWWDLTDQKSWQPHTGLLREDLSEKPAYLALEKLIRETWHTSAEGRTDGAGSFKFRGFSGTYEVFAEAPDGRTKSEKFELEKGKPGHFLIDFR